MLSTCVALAIGDTACAFALGLLIFMLVILLGGFLFAWCYKPAYWEYKLRKRGYVLLEELQRFDRHGPWPGRLRPGTTPRKEEA